MQIKRRFMLVLHDVVVHPIIGIWKALSPSTKPESANRLHDVTMPPLPKEDR